MKRTQIQFPEPLYESAKRLANDQDWTMAEVVRRALELYVAQHSKKQNLTKEWKMPGPLDLGGDFLQDPADIHAEELAINSRNKGLFE